MKRMNLFFVIFLCSMTLVAQNSFFSSEGTINNEPLPREENREPSDGNIRYKEDCGDCNVYLNYYDSAGIRVQFLLQSGVSPVVLIDISKPLFFTVSDAQNSPLTVKYYRYMSMNSMSNAIVYMDGNYLTQSFLKRFVSFRNDELWFIILMAEDENHDLYRIRIRQNGPWPRYETAE